jgi:beta-aspartyl-peptidase (threonine type)
MFVIVASENGAIGLPEAVRILQEGGSALNAIEAATRIVEANPEDHTVGFGGYPNILGDVEMDASIMEGEGRRIGAVAGLRGYLHAISVARAVMERLPHHALLVGEGAARFAREMGFAEQEMLTDEARAVWKQQLSRIDRSAPLAEQSRQATDPEKTAGTVNFLAIDSAGRMASAVSTSGWTCKYPGRVGDSPVIGAGNYCDIRYGACACTGIGEWAIRASAARMVVAGLEFGQDLDTSCRRVYDDLARIPLPKWIDAAMSLVALTPDGRHAAYSTAPDRRYAWASDQHPDVQIASRVHLPLERAVF